MKLPSLDTQTDAFSALAHPIRRQLLDLLLEGEQSVSQLAERFDVSRPAVSQHLKVLLDAGLVSEHRAGRQHLYRLQAAPFRAVYHWIQRYRDLWNNRFDQLEAHLQNLAIEEKNNVPDSE